MKNLVVLSGAGMSAESGISTFAMRADCGISGGTGGDSACP